jgi:hypothetical protein
MATAMSRVSGIHQLPQPGSTVLVSQDTIRTTTGRPLPHPTPQRGAIREQPTTINRSEQTPTASNDRL